MYILSLALWSVILHWVSAEDAFWIGGVSGNWNEAWRWSTNSVPTSSDTVYIVENGNYTVTLPHGVDARYSIDTKSLCFLLTLPKECIDLFWGPHMEFHNKFSL